jgi:hypothetical protein
MAYKGTVINLFPANPTTQNIIFVECGSEFIDPDHNILKYFTSHYNLKSEKHIFEIYIVRVCEKIIYDATNCMHFIC